MDIVHQYNLQSSCVGKFVQTKTCAFMRIISIPFWYRKKSMEIPIRENTPLNKNNIFIMGFVSICINLKQLKLGSFEDK